MQKGHPYSLSKTVQLADDILLVKGFGLCSNCYILLDNDAHESITIDAGRGPNSEAIHAAAGENIKFALLTHGHADHISGLDKLGCDGFVSEKDLKIIKELNYFIENFKPPKRLKSFSEMASESKDEIRFGNFSLKIIPTPGHTPGSVCFLDEHRGLLFSGDTLFAKSHGHEVVGRTDLPFSSDEEMGKSLLKLKALKLNTVFPGHGAIESLNTRAEE